MEFGVPLKTKTGRHGDADLQLQDWLGFFSHTAGLRSAWLLETLVSVYILTHLLPLASWERAVRATSLSPRTPLWEQQWEYHVVAGQRSLETWGQETHTSSGPLGFRRREQPHLEQAFPGALMLFFLPCPFCCLEPASCMVPQLFPYVLPSVQNTSPTQAHSSFRPKASVLTLLERLFLLPKELAHTTAN